MLGTCSNPRRSHMNSHVEILDCRICFLYQLCVCVSYRCTSIKRRKEKGCTKSNNPHLTTPTRHVMVGITRSKVFFVIHLNLLGSLHYQKKLLQLRKGVGVDEVNSAPSPRHLKIDPDTESEDGIHRTPLVESNVLISQGVCDLGWVGSTENGVRIGTCRFCFFLWGVWWFFF